MRRKVLSIIVISIMILTNCSTVFAAKSSADYKKEQQQTQSEANKAKEELNEVEGKLDTALDEVSKVSSSINTVEEEISTLSGKIEELDKSISAKEKDLSEKETLLDERLSAAYMNNNDTYLEALLSGGIVNFVSNYDMIKQIAEYDNNLITEVKDAKKDLEDKKQEVESTKSEKEGKSNELKGLKAEKQKKVDALSSEQKEIQNKIDDYDKQMTSLKKKEQEAAKKEAEAAKIAAAKAAAAKSASSSSSGSSSSSSSSTAARSSGKFLWPCPSSQRISSGYGYRIHPIYGTKKLHAGIDIAAAGGADIVAADSGTVILSSWGYNGGYGNYIIISHGNGYTTRYAHCSNLYVNVGDTVSRGQRIAAVGSTGSSTGNHLHFEVRINGESQPPLNYL